MQLAVVSTRLGLLVAFDVVHAKCTTQHNSTIQVIDRQDGGALIVVHQKSKTTSFALLPVPREVYVQYFAVLGEDCDYIALGQLLREPAHEDVCAVGIIFVPAPPAARDGQLELPLIDLLNGTDIATFVRAAVNIWE